MKNWKVNSWRKYPVKHIPEYPDKKELDQVLNKINHIPLIDNKYSIKDMAKDCSTIPYEIITSFGKRLKKVYIK